MNRNADRKQLDVDRCRAAQFFCEKYSREKRYLIIFQRDLQSWLNSEKFLLGLKQKISSDENWLSSDEGIKQGQNYFDFLCSFEELKEKMKEFRWSKDFLLENGIDFVALKKLYFALA